jgi:hypothetical protein
MTMEDFAPRTPNMLNDILEANSKYAETFNKPMSLGARKKVRSTTAGMCSNRQQQHLHQCCCCSILL